MCSYSATPIFLQVSLAAVLFNGYRREGHQFDINAYNKLLFGWVLQVSIYTDNV